MLAVQAFNTADFFFRQSTELILPGALGEPMSLAEKYTKGVRFQSAAADLKDLLGGVIEYDRRSVMGGVDQRCGRRSRGVWIRLYTSVRPEGLQAELDTGVWRSAIAVNRLDRESCKSKRFIKAAYPAGIAGSGSSRS